MKFLHDSIKNYATQVHKWNRFSGNLEILLKIAKFRQKKIYLFQQCLGKLIDIMEKWDLLQLSYYIQT